MSYVFEPGFFSSGPVHVALAVGAVVAVVCGVVGTLTVMRGQSFAGHSLADIGTTGGSGAYLVGVNPLFGFVAVNVVASAAMSLIGIERPRGRDLATGIVLGASLGLASLFLYWDTTTSSTTGATMSVLFGEIFVLSSYTVPFVAIVGAASIAIVTVLYRPLLLSSVSSELAAARGVRTRLVGASYLLAMALAVSLSAVTIGAILSTALLIGPAAIAVRLTNRTSKSMVIAASVGVVATSLGILLAYDSYYWTTHPWPVSFFVVAVIFTGYLAVSAVCRSQRRSRPRPSGTVH